MLIPRSPTPGSEETSSILNLLEGTRERLNHLLKPRPLLELDDLSALAEMCAYDSQAQGTDFATWSEWCHMFDSDEWEVLGYAKDVGRWYQVGEGSVSPPQSSLIRADDVAFWSYYGCKTPCSC